MSLIPTLTGLFKDVYANKIENLIPEAAKLTKAIPFVPTEKQNGGFYNQPVVLANEQGFTYAGPNAGAFDVNDSIGSTMGNAQVLGSSILLQSMLDYGQAQRANTGGKKAFANATVYLVSNMLESITKRVEIADFYGQSGLATTSATNGSPTATQTTVTVTDASWASGIWAGSENTQVEFYNGSTLISSGTDAVFTIVAVGDGATKTLRVSGSATGITALVAATATPLDIFYKGAFGKEMVGINKILENTGTLFSIDAAAFNLWKANDVTATGVLDYGKITAAIGSAVNRGGLNEDVTVFVNPNTFNDLTDQLVGLRRFDGAETKSVLGNKELSYYAQNGTVTVTPYNIIKNGDAFVLPMKRVKRLGAVDVSFKNPAGNSYDNEIFFQHPTKAGFVLRAYTDQAIFLETPAKAVKISGFTNTVN
jgi:hypothetical protein